MYPVKASTKHGFISGCHYAEHAHVCTHAVRCVTEHPRLMPQLMPGHLQNTGRNGCLGSSHDIGKDQWQNQIKCHLDCSERKDCWTSARQRICSSPFLFGSSFSFPSRPPPFFLHFLSKSRYCSQAEYLFRFLCFAYVKPEWTYRRKGEIILRDWEMWASGLGQAISWLITQLQGGAEKDLYMLLLLIHHIQISGFGCSFSQWRTPMFPCGFSFQIFAVL